MARIRQVPVRIGDSLPVLALREMGDRARWKELIPLNRLRPPYLIESLDEADRQPGVLLWGDWISVPALAVNDGAALGEDALGRDVLVTRGQLMTRDGDLDLVEGTPNFVQALRHRVMTPYGTFLPHPTYGCEIHTLLGLGNGPAMALLGAGLVRRAMLRDPRSAAIAAAGSAQADQLRIGVQAQSVTRETVTDVNVIYQLPAA